MTDQLIIVGASARAAAFSALRAGFRPFAIDQYADRDLAALCPAVRIQRYPHDFVAALREAPQAPWIYTGGLENYPRLVDRLAEIRPLWGNRGDVLRPVRDPWLLAEVVRRSRLEMPTMRRDWKPGDACEGGATWLRKSLRSGGGRKIRIAPSGPQQFRQGCYYQRYVSGHSCGAVFLAAKDKCHFLGVSQQLRGQPGEFNYPGSMVQPGPWHPRMPLLRRLAQSLTDRFGLRGLFNVDFIRNRHGDWPLEVNPRYSASVEVLERATGMDYLALHAAAFDPAVPGPMSPLPVSPPTRTVGKAIVYADGDARVPPEFDQLVEAWNANPAWPGIADLPRVGDLVLQGQPICTVFAEAECQEEVEHELRERVRRVRQVVGAAKRSGGGRRPPIA